MSKKMSMQDMKEVRRIVTTLLTDSVELNHVIKAVTYNRKTTFNSNFSYGYFRTLATSLVDSYPKLQELTDLERLIIKKRDEIIKNISKLEMPQDDTEEYVSSLISTLKMHVEANIERKCVDMVHEVTGAYNEYLNKLESRTFDAYTKGMSADDFLEIIKDEIKALQDKANNLIEVLKNNEYISSEK